MMCHYLAAFCLNSLLILQVYCEILRIDSNNKYAGVFTTIKQNRILIGGVTLTLNLDNINSCIFACMQYSQCKSCSASMIERKCLLHENNEEGSGTTLELRNGWNFFSPETNPSNVSEKIYISLCIGMSK